MDHNNRRPIVAGNWKMHKTSGESAAAIRELIPLLPSPSDIDVVVCPPYTALSQACQAAEGSRVAIGAQDLFWKTKGAYTGKVSAPMLVDLGVRYVIVGHSESRGRFGVADPDFGPEVLCHFGDTDETVNRKLRAALEHDLTPICCVGEILSERASRHTDSIVQSQAARAVVGLEPSQIPRIVFAYEPVWAIGTGEVCDADEANRVCGVIRDTIRTVYGDSEASRIRIQYGGSVKPDNAEGLLRRPEIDGVLVGGASLVMDDFAAILHACP